MAYPQFLLPLLMATSKYLAYQIFLGYWRGLNTIVKKAEDKDAEEKNVSFRRVWTIIWEFQLRKRMT